MKLVSYWKNSHPRAAVQREAELFDLESAMLRIGAKTPVSDMRAFLEQMDWQQTVADIRDKATDVEPIPISGVRLAAPVPMPRKLLIAGANTRSHLREAAPLVGEIAPPKNPMILAKATSAISGPYDNIVLPPETAKLDYEVELGVVIGRQCRRVREQDVRSYVAGFVTINEVSARDVQLAEDEDATFYRAHFVGKSFDTFCPMGPALTTVDEFEWNRPLRLKTFVNGEIRQDSDTSDLIHGVDRIISYISSALTLFPGDIIATGSPAGVGIFMNPPRYLKDGDVVRCEIESIGAIENKVRAE